MTLTVHGIGVSKGIAIGKIHIFNPKEIEIHQYCIPQQHLEDEIDRFQRALVTAHDQLRQARAKVPKHSSVDIVAFIDAHLIMLEDSFLTRGPVELIQSHQCNAEWALKLQHESILKIFEQAEDPYLKARKMDMEQVINRIQRILLGQPALSVTLEETAFSKNIVLANDLNPAEIILMHHYGVVALVTESGGETSHTAILARSLGIPAIVGLRHAPRYLQNNETVIVDGSRGVLLLGGDETILHYYQQRRQAQKDRRIALSALKSAPIVTKDGVPIILQSNIEFPEDMRTVKEVSSEGVGLYRTEFLFMNRSSPPDEEEHLEAYLQVIRALDGQPVTIRTLDIGLDKLEGKKVERPLASNPALGLRAIRLCLKDQKLFKPQLRAILRASAAGQVRMMIPLVSSFQEITQLRHILVEIRKELKQKSQPFDPDLPIGIMVEVPAMAICTDLFAPCVDFLSIGTNDLIQYTLALDRGDDAVNYLYDPAHPAVLRLIKMTIDAADQCNKPISMCGEMAGDGRYVRLLLGLGLRSFSVNPESFLEVKQIIINSQLAGLTHLATQILETGAHADIMALLERLNRH